MPRLVSFLSLVAAMSMTGANVPLAKVLAEALPVETLLVLRFSIASVALFLIARWERGARLRSLDSREWLAVLALSLFGSVLFTWAIVEGVKRTTGANAGIITAALPAVVALFGVMLGEGLRRGEVAMIGLAMAGLGLVHGSAPGTFDVAARSLFGNLLIGLAVICEAIFVVVARGISSRVPPLCLSLAVALVSLVLTLPTGIAGLDVRMLAYVTTGTWLLLIWYALTASVLCTVLWYRGAAHVEAWAAGLATAAVPVAAVLVSALALGEQISPAQVAGAAMVVAAIMLGAWSRR